jgi:AcrR family transcriptional regulator
MCPVHFEVVEVLEEMDCRHGPVGEVGNQDDEIPAALPLLVHFPYAEGRDAENEHRRKPDQPVRLQLFSRSFKFLVSQMPLQIYESPNKLTAKANQQGGEELWTRLLKLAHKWLFLLRYDTVSRCDAVCNRLPVTPTRRLNRAEKQAETKAALLEAAADAFTRVGFEAATVDAITEAAGFSRGAFYSNFESKEALFVSLIESRIGGRLQDIASAFQVGDTASERIHSGGRFLDSLVGQDRQWCLLYMEFWGRAVREPKLRRRFADQYEAWRTGIAQIIETQAKELGVTLDASPRELASALIALFEGHVLQRLIDPTGLEEGFFTRLLLRFFERTGAAEHEGTGLG